MKAEIILTNACFITLEDEETDFVAIKDGKIIGTGSSSQIECFLAPDTHIIDLYGKTVVPGFIDSHVHLIETGLNLLAIDLTEVSSLKELQEKLCYSHIEGQWIRGYGLDETCLVERRLPLKEELDAINRKKPIYISRRDHHCCILNSCGIEELKLSPPLEGADFHHGIFRASSNYYIKALIHNSIHREQKIKAVDLAARLAISRGITTLHAMEGGQLFGEEDADIVREYTEKLPLNIVLYHQTTDINRVLAQKLPRIGGCLLVDGSIGSHTAAFFEPYADEPHNYGNLYFSDEKLTEFIIAASKRQLQIALHAIGDRAVEQVLKAHTKAQEVFKEKSLRHRIEHAELVSESQMEKIQELGISLGVQPAFEDLWGGEGKMYFQRLGQDRARRTNPLKRYIEKGILIAGGSDSDVTPMDPLRGMKAARQHPHPPSRLSAVEALKLFTINGAKIAFEEELKGSIRVNKNADFTIISANPLQEKVNLDEIKIDMTIVKGKIVYRA